MRNLASLFCVGLSGQTLNDQDKRVLDRGVGAIVLFARNVDTPEQVASLIEEARRHAGEDVLACVDQEGGGTVRLERGFTAIPSMRALGKAGDAALAFEVGQCLGSELRGAGFDLDFAPILDVDTNPDNPVIGDRSLGGDPELVATLGQRLIEGLQSQGIIACGKHFPGHGDTHQDSHYELPCLPHDLDRMNAVELHPFKRVIEQAKNDGSLAIMTAHVVFEQIDDSLPGTLCPAVLTKMLRETLGFRGLCISDCMEMKAIADGERWGGIAGAAVQGIAAGVDMPLVCHTHAVMHASIDAVEDAYKEGTLCEDRIAQALDALERTRQFRRAQRKATIAPFAPTEAFRTFVESHTARSHDPTWQSVDGAPINNN